MNRPVRAAVESGLVMAAGILAVGLAAVTVAVNSPETVAGEGFGRASGLAAVATLLVFGGAAGALAARRLPGPHRLPLALAGPLAVTTLAALPAAADGQWAGVLLYELGALAGTTAGVLLAGTRR